MENTTLMFFKMLKKISNDFNQLHIFVLKFGINRKSRTFNTNCYDDESLFSLIVVS